MIDQDDLQDGIISIERRF